MSLWSRFTYVFRGDRLNNEIDEEFAAHIAEAIAAGEDPREVHRTFGSPLRLREQSRDARIAHSLDSLRADTIFGWRQLMKNKVTTAAAVLSLALAIGACTSAFRLIHALFLRPLPVAHSDRLYGLTRQGFDDLGESRIFDDFAYPNFTGMRAAVKGHADLIALSFTRRTDLTYATNNEIEKAHVQYVSGDMFSLFELRPVFGRLFTGEDDLTPGAHPYAVLSYDYWSRRFANDPEVIGRTLHIGGKLFQIVGVGPKSFTGTEPGTVVDIFLPTMMHPDVTRTDNSWIRILAIVRPNLPLEPLRAQLDTTSLRYETERAKGFVGMSRQLIEKSLQKKMLVSPAGSGMSALQDDYRNALIWLSVLVTLVLLIACANVANLMTAQAASRVREMALRVSIGAGRARLVRLILIQNLMLAIFSATFGVLFAWWAAPFVVSHVNPVDNPAHLILPADWRVLAFGTLLTFVVTLVFGLTPALRASAIQPVTILKGGKEPQARHRSMYVLITAQIAFCFAVLFFAELFVMSFRHLAGKPLGFEAKDVLLVETSTPQGQSPQAWAQMAETLRTVPGVTDVAFANWPMVSHNAWTGSIAVPGVPRSDEWGSFFSASPGWISTMKMQLIEGRDFVPTDAFPGAAIVNQTFVKDFFHGEDPIGRTFEKVNPRGTRQRCQVIGIVADTPYSTLRDPVLPIAYVPFTKLDENGAINPAEGGTFAIRTPGVPAASLASSLRRLVTQTNTAYRVDNIQTQQEILDNQSLRERLLALLAGFFATIALLLAAIGLYGVFRYTVVQREREIGIRIAVGARLASIARLVSTPVITTVLVGSAIGTACGVASVRYVETLLFGVKGTEPSMFVAPAAVLLVASLLAALPAIFRAARIDPSIMLRAD